MKTKKMMWSLASLSLLLLLAAALFINSGSALSVKAEGEKKVNEARTVQVSGQGKVTVEPDVAYIQLGVSTQESDATTASAANNGKMAKLMEAVKALGIDDKDVKTISFSIYPQYNYQADRPVIYAYEVQNIVQITVKDVARTGEILVAAIDAGGNTVQNVSYDLLNKKAAYAEALGKAVKDAADKATVVADAAELTLDKVPRNLSEATDATYPIFNRSMNYAEMQAAPGSGNSVPLASNQILITASVVAEYLIMP